MKLDDELCHCFHVSQRKILNFLRVRRPRRPSQLAECGGAGTGCGWCVPFLKRCFEQSQTGVVPVSGVAATEVLADVTLAEYAQQRREYILSGQGSPPSIPSAATGNATSSDGATPTGNAT